MTCDAYTVPCDVFDLLRAAPASLSILWRYEGISQRWFGIVHYPTHSAQTSSVLSRTVLVAWSYNEYPTFRVSSSMYSSPKALPEMLVHAPRKPGLM